MKELDNPSPHEPAAAAAAKPHDSRLRQSPMTDPRALIASLAIHVTLLAVTSVVIFRAVNPKETPAPSRTVVADLGPSDNRASSEPSQSGGGGELIGEAVEAAVEPGSKVAATQAPAADALLSEILPSRSMAETPQQTLPGPSTTAPGVINGTSLGESGGRGQGEGGGIGQGTGPGTEFFGMRDKGTSYAYVIDRSGSMTAKNSLDVAKRELLASLAQVPAEARFAVIFYNLDATVFTDPNGRPGLMAATPANKARVRALLAGIPPDGGTDHMRALHTALDLKPEVLFFLTDADLMTRQDVDEILSIAGKTRIQTVEFGLASGLGGSTPLRNLARATGGLYRYIDVKTFGPR